MKLSNIFKRKPKSLPQEKSWTLTDQGYMNTGWDPGWWQQNLSPGQISPNEAVEACVSALSQTVAMCPIYLYDEQENNELVRKKGSYQERVLYKPNEYTTRSQFFNQLIRCMYFQGNGYAVTTRDNNRAINGLYIVDPRTVNGVIDPETGDVYYWVGKDFSRQYNPDTDLVYPARDVLNLRINPRAEQPLVGETPITSAANSINANSSIIGHQSKFFKNMARPSGVLSTDATLNKDQMLQLRDAVYAQTQGENSGKIPILGHGLKFSAMSLTSQDSQLVEAFGMTVQSISRVFRVPLPLINSMENSTFNNAEALINWFLASGLGFLLEHIELELNALFNLPFNMRFNFNTKVLLRSDWKTQMEALGQGTLSGVYSPDEARAEVGLGPVAGGAEPRVQQQVVPLSAWSPSQQPEAPPAPEPSPADVAAAFTKGYENARKAS